MLHAYEISATTTPTGTLNIIDMLPSGLPPNLPVRIIVLVPEPVPYDADLTPEEEDEAWLRLGEVAALARYDEEDAVYDHVAYQPLR